MSQMQSLVQQSIACFFALAVFFFVMIFLLSAGLDHSAENQTIDNVVIQQNEQATWGQIPGTLGINAQASLSLYSFNSDQTAGEVDMTKQDPITWTGNRNFTQLFWYPQKSVVSYVYNNTIEDAESVPTEKNVSYPNLGAVNAWEQLKTKPKFMQAWEALNEASNLLFSAEMLNRFYAYNAYYYIFYDYAQVQQYVLVGLESDPTAQHDIYTDPNFGMNSVKGLTWWVSALQHGEGSQDYDILVQYYAKMGIDLTSDVMVYITGPKAMLTMIVNTLSQQVRTDPNLFQSTGSINVREIAQGQWGDCAVIYDNMMVGLPLTYSLAAMDETLPSAPEFGAYVLNATQGDGTQAQAFNISMSKKLLEQDPGSYESFLNSLNMQYFFEQYEIHEYEALLERFGFDSPAQIDMFADYLDALVENFLYQRGASADMVEMGTLVYKQIQDTFTMLEDTLPLTVASRVVTANIANADAAGDYGTQTSCEYFVSQSGIADTTTACTNVDFTNPNSLLVFMNVTWFPDNVAYYDQMITLTGFTSDEWNLFMDTTTSTTSFGYVYQTSLASIATKYGCYGGVNCTSLELAAIQYGSSGVTNDPVVTSQTYLPQSNTVAQWGSADWMPYGMLTVSPEFSYISIDPAEAIIDTQVSAKVGQANTTFFGLGDKFICQTLMTAYYTQDKDILDAYTQWWGTSFNLDNFLMSVRNDIQTRYFGGAGYVDYSPEELIYGFETDYASLLNSGGVYYNGDSLGLQNMTTPIFHDLSKYNTTNTTGSQTVYGTYTGANDVAMIGYLRLVNNLNGVNRIAKIWNGVSLEESAVLRPVNGDTGLVIQDIQFNNVSYGMQFPPGMGKTTIKAYDEAAILISDFDYDTEQTIGSKDLSLYKYKSSKWAGDLTFANQLPLVQEPLGCYGCTPSTDDTRSLMVDGAAVTPATSEPNNYMMVQPDTGYTYEKAKQSSVYFTLGGKQQQISNSNYIPSPFPSLDEIYGISVPFYDLSNTQTADEGIFTDNFNYVASTEGSTRGIIISFSVLAGLFLVLGIVALVMTKLTGAGRSSSRDDLLQAHMDEDEE